MRKRVLSEDAYVEGITSGDRSVLARAITLVESERASDAALASRIITRTLPLGGRAYRVGVSGVPGVGKSTFIDAFGTLLTEEGFKVAVLAVDPSSTISGGSILGDKTRMPRLSRDPSAFVRPSPTGGTLGGVARKTQESMLLCEAFGFDVVLVETVGVGQSEIMVSEMVDFLLGLMLAGAGDGLQGIKRGILEVVDMVAVNKADGDNVLAAQRARREYELALRLLRAGEDKWMPPVQTCSARAGTGLRELWEAIQTHRNRFETELNQLRGRQAVRWMWRLVEDSLSYELKSAWNVREVTPGIEAKVASGELPPTLAANELLGAFRAFLDSER
ncbi:MAG: methylmalonyl Co-A mutase-associated GTPase MeaB [Myxococcota bacterium]